MSRIEGYDKGYHIMNVHELVMRISDTSCLWTTKELSTLESALRKAVVREASVGAVYVARDFTNGCPEFRFKCPESLTGAVKSEHICQLCGELIPERQYMLIPSNLAPKEIPEIK